MSLDKAIKSGKERRKSYRRGKAIDGHCRNHGGCPACESNRFNATKKREISAKEQMNDPT